jgi:ABC-type antimicrobial peptide transport system permease subunit
MIRARVSVGELVDNVRCSVLRQTLSLAAAGMAIGVPIAWMAFRALRGSLFGVESSDPLTFATVVILLVAVVSPAGYVLARRAARVDPVTRLMGDLS